MSGPGECWQCGTLMECAEYDQPVEYRGASSIRDAFVVIDTDRDCHDCQRFHDVGAIMQMSSANVHGRIKAAYFCGFDDGCDPLRHIDYTGDVPTWKPALRRMAS